MSLFHLHFKRCFTGFRILHWQYFFFWNFTDVISLFCGLHYFWRTAIIFHCSPESNVFITVITNIFYCYSERNVYFFCLLLRFLSLFLFFSQFDCEMLRCASFFCMVLPVIHRALWVYGLTYFINFRKYLAVIFSNVSFAPFFLFSPGTSNVHIPDNLLLNHRSSVLFVFVCVCVFVLFCFLLCVLHLGNCYNIFCFYLSFCLLYVVCF